MAAPNVLFTKLVNSDLQQNRIESTTKSDSPIKYSNCGFAKMVVNRDQQKIQGTGIESQLQINPFNNKMENSERAKAADVDAGPIAPSNGNSPTNNELLRQIGKMCDDLKNHFARKSNRSSQENWANSLNKYSGENDIKKCENFNNKSEESPAADETTEKINKLLQFIANISSNKVITEMPPPEQQPVFEIREKEGDKAENGHYLDTNLGSDFQFIDDLDAQFDQTDKNGQDPTQQVYPPKKFDRNWADKQYIPNFVPNTKPMSEGQFRPFNKVINKNQIMSINCSVPVEGIKFSAERGRLIRQSKSYPLKIIQTSNTKPSNLACFGTGCFELEWNYFPTVKSKANNKIVTHHPTSSFRLFAEFAKHDWSMIAKAFNTENFDQSPISSIQKSKICQEFLVLMLAHAHRMAQLLKKSMLLKVTRTHGPISMRSSADRPTMGHANFEQNSIQEE